MSTKKVTERNERQRNRLCGRRTLAATCLAFSLVIASGAIAHRAGRVSKGQEHGKDAVGEVTIQSLSASSPSKELIYAGAKLVASEEAINFADVTPSTPFYNDILKLARKGVTLGCGTNALGQPIYCPDGTVTREQMAAFIIRALGDFNPPTPGSQRFLDVPPTNIFYNFIEQMAVRGITLGCGGGNYCPTQSVAHEQMAAFIMRALGESDPPTPPSQRFNDVAPSNCTQPCSPNIFYNFIDRMAVLNIWPGCNGVPGSNYCPASLVTRAEMAHILVQAFGADWQ